MTEKAKAADQPDQLEGIRAGYTFTGAAMQLGAAVTEGGTAHADVPVNLPLSVMNRHGLVAGATGTGKTKTLQLMAEQLSANGVPVFVADIKGDLSGVSTPGADSEKTKARATEVGQQWQASGFPVEFYSLGGQGSGIPMRATITSFGPTLLAKVLGLNATQTSSLGLIFHYADARGLDLLDIKDLRAVVQHLTSDEGKEDLKGLGGLSSATAGVILRTLIAFSDQGADVFFGEPEYDTADLMRTAGGRGVISCLELPAVQDRPKMFSTFLMWLLADLFHDMPEVGDVDKPKLVFFFDEAHLLFDDASKEFLDSIEQTVRLIRSKGVGVFFVTQTPKDVPAVGAGSAWQPRPARTAGVHPGGRQGAAGDGVDVPQERVRPGGAAHPARHRRGRRDRSVRAWRADAGGLDPHAGPAVADGSGRPGQGRGGRQRLAAAG